MFDLKQLQPGDLLSWWAFPSSGKERQFAIVLSSPFVGEFTWEDMLVIRTWYLTEYRYAEIALNSLSTWQQESRFDLHIMRNGATL